MAKLTVRIPQVRHQALRLAAVRRDISLQALIGEMIEAYLYEELKLCPHCDCLKAALGSDDTVCDKECNAFD